MATIKEVATHFNLSVQGASQYIKAHLDELNRDGEHVTRPAGQWVIDKVAWQRLEDMRGFVHAGVAQEMESERVKELVTIQNNLQTALVLAQNERIEVDKQFQELQGRVIQLQQNLSREAREEAERRARDAAKIARLEADQEHARQEAERLRQEKEELKQALVSAGDELKRLKGRGLLDRLLNNE